MSSTNSKLEMGLPPMLTVLWWFSRASVIILSRKINEKVGREQIAMSYSHGGIEPFPSGVV